MSPPVTAIATVKVENADLTLQHDFSVAVVEVGDVASRPYSVHGKRSMGNPVAVLVALVGANDVAKLTGGEAFRG